MWLAVALAVIFGVPSLFDGRDRDPQPPSYVGKERERIRAESDSLRRDRYRNLNITVYEVRGDTILCLSPDCHNWARKTGDQKTMPLKDGKLKVWRESK